MRDILTTNAYLAPEGTVAKLHELALEELSDAKDSTDNVKRIYVITDYQIRDSERYVQVKVVRRAEEIARREELKFMTKNWFKVGLIEIGFVILSKVVGVPDYISIPGGIALGMVAIGYAVSKKLEYNKSNGVQDAKYERKPELEFSNRPHLWELSMHCFMKDDEDSIEFRRGMLN